MNSIALRVDGLGKEYVLGQRAAPYATLRDLVMSGLSAPLRLLGSGRRKRAAAEHIWALRDVSFEVKSGEVVGVIGRNGAGKSTLLKILSRITSPTRGRVELHGRVGSLLEVGTGFHGELTGRENIILNGAILGMRRAEIARHFDGIVDFAEMEQFIDTPVKHYSSGMYLRLAFAVAAYMDTEVLLIDEVLAVGDAAFQSKCLGKMGEVARTGRTVLFVSHNMAAVTGLCDRALWIDKGLLAMDGAVDEVMNAYLSSIASTRFQFESDTYGLAINAVTLRNSRGDPSACFMPGEDLIVEVDFATNRPVAAPYFVLVVQGAQGPCFTASMLLDGQRPEVLDGQGKLKCRFHSIPLLPQRYAVRMRIMASEGREFILKWQEVASFSVEGNVERDGFLGERFLFHAPGLQGVISPYEWVLPNGSVRRVEVSHREPAASQTHLQDQNAK